MYAQYRDQERFDESRRIFAVVPAAMVGGDLTVVAERSDGRSLVRMKHKSAMEGSIEQDGSVLIEVGESKFRDNGLLEFSLGG